MLDWVAVTVNVPGSWLHCVDQLLSWVSRTRAAFHASEDWELRQRVCCARDGPMLLKQAFIKAMTGKECTRTAAWANTRTQQAMVQLWPCSECCVIKKSRQALSVHAFTSHGSKCAARQYVIGTHCLTCLSEFGCRSRVASHLAYRSVACIGALMSSMTPL